MKFQELYQTYPIIRRKKKSIAELSHLPKADLANCRVEAKPKVTYTELDFNMEAISSESKRGLILQSIHKARSRSWSMLLF